MEADGGNIQKSSSWSSFRSLTRSSSGGSGSSSLPRSNSWSDLVNASGDFNSLQELTAPSVSRPLEEENVLIDQVEAVLRAAFADAPARIGHEQSEQPHVQSPRADISPQSHDFQTNQPTRAQAHAIQIPSREFLRICLRVWQHRVDDAARIARNFATFRSKEGWPYAISARDVEPELRSQVHWLLEGRDREGRGILVYNARHVVPCLRSNKSVPRMQRMGSYLMERAIRRDHVVANGMVFVVDCADVDLSLTTCFRIADVRRGVMMWKDAFPCKCKKVYLLNAPFLLSGLISLASKMLSSKIQQRIVLVNDSKTGLFQDIPESVLPEELGGTAKLEWNAMVDAFLAEEATTTDAHAGELAVGDDAILL